MKYVLLIYQGTTPLPGSERWQALPAVEQKAIYADYAEINKAPGVAPGLPLGLPDAAMTVQVPARPRSRWPGGSMTAAPICAPWRIECWARPARPKTPSRKPG
jgi:hypothetical protein